MLRVRRCDGDVAVLEVSGEVDAREADTIRVRGMELLRSSCRVVLDLSSVQFMGARGLTALLTIQERAASTSRRLLVVTGVNQRVLRPIHICGLQKVVVLAVVVDEAPAMAPPDQP